MGKFNRMVWVVAAGILTAACSAAGPASQPATLPTKKTGEILKAMEQMADAQIAQLSGKYPAEWVNGTFYSGLARLSHVSGNDSYKQVQLDIAKQNNWEVKTSRNGAAASPFHADNECIAQMYIDLALTRKEPDNLAALTKTFNDLVAYADGPAPAGGYPGGKPLLWWWADALYMGPAGLTRMSVATGDDKYIKEMDKQYWITYELLYDKQEHLFFRDATYLTKTAANGKKLFWARGNGWVVGGLANILTYMPADFAARPKYVALFKEMAGKLGEIQQPDGLWRSSLLDPEQYPMAETSGSAFFCYGLAWGINNGMLERAKYEPMVDKAWDALLAHRRADGLIGWVQDVGSAPGKTVEAGTKPYAVGAFLLAGAEMMKLGGK